MDFIPAVTKALTDYAVFTGRSPRSEYWWFALFNILTLTAVSLVGALLHDHGILYTLGSLALLLPSLALAVRRMHDLDRSGWWLLVGFVPVIGTILLLVWFCTRGTGGPNQFGQDPFAGQGFTAAS